MFFLLNYLCGYNKKNYQAMEEVGEGVMSRFSTLRPWLSAHRDGGPRVVDDILVAVPQDVLRHVSHLQHQTEEEQRASRRYTHLRGTEDDRVSV